MKSRKNSKNLQNVALNTDDVDSDNSDKITAIFPSAQPFSVEPSPFIYEPPPGRIIRSRRNTFTYGQVGEGSTSQTSTTVYGSTTYDSHNELIPYSKEWTVILYVFFY
jgi:hypothetical protein